MLEEINTIFDEARLAVKKAKAADGQRTCADIVLILDNLEKIRKISGLDEGLASQRELFLERYTHCVWCVLLMVPNSNSVMGLYSSYR